MEQGRYRLALRHLKRAERSAPGNADVHNLLGFSYRSIGEIELAFVHYRKALEIDPQHLGAHEYLGELYLMQNEPRRAEDHLKAIEESPACASRCKALEELKAAIEAYREKHGG